MKTELVSPVLAVPHSRHPRSPGVHVSSIIRRIAIQNGALKKEWIDDLDLVDASQEDWWASLSPASQLRIAIGLAWEEWYIPQLQTVSDHPGEMQVDGIYMTHDGESLDTLVTERPIIINSAWGAGEPSRHVLALHEVKGTYKSTKTVGSLDTQWMWLAQTKAYCKGLNTLIAYLHVLFLCGDYKYPIEPQLKVWRITYTQLEIDDNWELMVGSMHHHRQQEREDLMRDTHE